MFVAVVDANAGSRVVVVVILIGSYKCVDVLEFIDKNAIDVWLISNPNQRVSLEKYDSINSIFVKIVMYGKPLPFMI